MLTRGAVDRAAALESDRALTLDTIGVVLSRLGNHNKAVQVFQKAVDADPANPGFAFNLGSSLKFLGDFDAAENAYESAISASPRFYKVHSSLAQLRRQTPEKNHIQRLEALLSNVRDDLNGELHLRHALAKEYEDIGEYDKAFENLKVGSRKKRAKLKYSVNDDRKLFACLESLFNDQSISGPSAGHATAEPIFVVGMPRTGTTLTARILTNHSAVYSAGELHNFSLSLKRATGTRSNVVLDIETLQRGMDLDFAALGETYLESTRPATGHTPHFTDKMPLNFMYIGFIHLALPNAKIICLRRNPLDTCLSNFRQLFGVDFSYYNYAYDLADVGEYYIRFHQLIEHWQSILNDKILEVRYEAIVADQESATRRMLDHCGIEWEDACLAFDENLAPVATASSVQVRQPLYDSAVARWRRYEKHLGPLKELLEGAGIQVE